MITVGVCIYGREWTVYLIGHMINMILILLHVKIYFTL
jgi:hypothetical protein